MRKVQFGVLLMLLGLMLGVIVACGGDNATSTPVPTNTPAATNTPVPPTNTPPPPATNPPVAAAPASAADVALISDAVTATTKLKSYHAVVDGSGDVFTQTLHIEG